MFYLYIINAYYTQHMYNIIIQSEMQQFHFDLVTVLRDVHNLHSSISF